MPAKNPPEERLVNLVVALTSTEQGLTKDAILSSVAGYREQFEADLAAALIEMISDPERAAEMGRKSRIRCEEHFSWDVIGTRTVAVYEDAARSVS